MVALVAALLLSPPTVVSTINTGSKPCGSAVYGKYLYVDNYGAGTMSRIDPATNKVVKRITVGSGPCGVVAGGGALWVEDYYRREIIRVDPRHFRVTKRIRVGRKPWDVAYAFGSVWATNQVDGTVSRIDPKRNKVVKTIGFDGSPTCIRGGAGAIWVGSQGRPNIFRIDPVTNAVTVVPVGNGSELCVDPHADGVWVSDDTSGSVTRIDPTTNKVVSTIAVGRGPSDGVRGPDGLEWIPNVTDGTVSRIDPATDEVVDTITVGGSPFVVRSAFGDIWVGDFGGSTITRIHPPVAGPRPRPCRCSGFTAGRWNGFTGGTHRYYVRRSGTSCCTRWRITSVSATSGCSRQPRSAGRHRVADRVLRATYLHDEAYLQRDPARTHRPDDEVPDAALERRVGDGLRGRPE